MGRRLPWDVVGTRKRPIELDEDNIEVGTTVGSKREIAKERNQAPRTKRRKAQSCDIDDDKVAVRQELPVAEPTLEQSGRQQFLKGLNLCKSLIRSLPQRSKEYLYPREHFNVRQDLIEDCIAYGAVKSSVWSALVTHVIACHPDSEQPQDILDRYEQSNHHDTPILRHEWLAACLSQRCIVEPNLQFHLVAPGKHKLTVTDDDTSGFTNPFANDRDAKQEDETVEDFLDRLSPKYDLVGLPDRRFQVACLTSYPYDHETRMKSFTEAGQTILSKYDSAISKTRSEHPAWGISYIKSIHKAEREGLLAQITEAASTYDVPAGKWIFFGINAAVITDLWESLVHDTVTGSLGAAAEVMLHPKTRQFTVCVRVLRLEEKDRALQKTKALMAKHDVVLSSGPKFKPEALSLLGLRSGNHYGIHVAV